MAVPNLQEGRHVIAEFEMKNMHEEDMFIEQDRHIDKWRPLGRFVTCRVCNAFVRDLRKAAL
jgi:hypothetical protein